MIWTNPFTLSASALMSRRTRLAWRRLTLCAAVALLGGSAQGALLDDYTGDLSNYTSTVILDAENPGSNVSTWTIVDEELALETTSYDGIEQLAFIYNGASLGVGQELQADFSDVPLPNQRNFGLYVGGTEPTTGVREDYITVYLDQANSTVRSRGFDGTSEYNNPGAGPAVGGDTLFIARTGANEFEAGFYSGGARTVVIARTPSFANSADYIGFYADVREAGTIGYADNLRIVPEPSALALTLLGGLGLFGRVRRL